VSKNLRIFIGVFVFALGFHVSAKEPQADQSIDVIHDETDIHANDSLNRIGSFSVSPKISTSFPVFVGSGVQFGFGQNFAFDVLYGFVPEPYYNTIASVGADIGDEPVYEELINAGFDENAIIKASLLYRLPTASRKWSLGANYYVVDTDGRAEIDEVLSALTGKDYTVLKNLLIAAGRDTKVDLEGKIQILEIQGAYRVLDSPKWSSQITFGIAKVLTAEAEVKTGLKNFEASNAGKQFLKETETELEDIVVENGLTPTIGIDLTYHF
jgi:hypothetical protein